MAAEKKNICHLLSFLMIFIYLRTATTTNIDCSGKPFHCINSTHFMICVDFGAGVLKTVDDYVIHCPPSTVCSENNNFECEYQPPTTTESIIRLSDETKQFEINTQTSTTEPFQKTSVTEFFSDYLNTVSATTQSNVFKDLHKQVTSVTVDTTETYSNTNNISAASDINFDYITTTIAPHIVKDTNGSYDTSIVDYIAIAHNETSKTKTKDFKLRDVAEKTTDSSNHYNHFIISPTAATFDELTVTDSLNEMLKEPTTKSITRKNSQNIIKISPLATIKPPKDSYFDNLSSTTTYVDMKNNSENTKDNKNMFLTKSEIQTDKPIAVNIDLILPNYTAVQVTNYTITERSESPGANISADTKHLLESNNITEVSTRSYFDEITENRNFTIQLEYLPTNITDETIIAKPTENYKLQTLDEYTSDMYFSDPNMSSSVQLVNITFSLPSLTITEPTMQNSTASLNVTKSSVINITTEDKKVFLTQSDRKTADTITTPPTLISLDRSASKNTNNGNTTQKTAESALINTILGPAVNTEYTTGNNLVFTTLEPIVKITEYIAQIENSTESVLINTNLDPKVKSTENNALTESVTENALINIVELTAKSIYNATQGPLVNEILNSIAKSTDDSLVIKNTTEGSLVNEALKAIAKSTEDPLVIKNATEGPLVNETLNPIAKSTEDVLVIKNATQGPLVNETLKPYAKSTEDLLVIRDAKEGSLVNETLKPIAKPTKDLLVIWNATEGPLVNETSKPIAKSTEDHLIVKNKTEGPVVNEKLKSIAKPTEDLLVIWNATEGPLVNETSKPIAKSKEDHLIVKNKTEGPVVNENLKSIAKPTEDLSVIKNATMGPLVNETVNLIAKSTEGLLIIQNTTEAPLVNETLKPIAKSTADLLVIRNATEGPLVNETTKPIWKSTEDLLVIRDAKEGSLVNKTLKPIAKPTEGLLVIWNATKGPLVNETSKPIAKSTEDRLIEKNKTEGPVVNENLKSIAKSTEDFLVIKNATKGPLFNETLKPTAKSTEDLSVIKNATKDPLVNETLNPIAKSTEDLLVIKNATQGPSVNETLKPNAKSTEDILVIKKATKGPLVNETLNPIAKSTEDLLVKNNSTEGPSVNETLKLIEKSTEGLLIIQNTTEGALVNETLKPIAKSTGDLYILQTTTEGPLVNEMLKLLAKSTEDLFITQNITEGPLVNELLKPIAKSTEDLFLINNVIERASVNTALEPTGKPAEYITDMKYATESASYYTTLETAVTSTEDDIVRQYNIVTENLTKSSEKAVNTKENSSVTEYATTSILTLGPSVQFTEDIPITKVTESAPYFPTFKSTENVVITEHATKSISDTILELTVKSTENIVLITNETESPSVIRTLQPTVKSSKDFAFTDNITENNLINTTLESIVKSTEDVTIAINAMESTLYDTTLQPTVNFIENITDTQILEIDINFTEDIVDTNNNSENFSRNTTLKPTEKITGSDYMTTTLDPTDKSSADSTVTMNGTKNALINTTVRVETIGKSGEDFIATMIVTKLPSVFPTLESTVKSSEDIAVTEFPREIVSTNTTLQPTVISTKDYTVAVNATGSDNITSKLQVKSIEDIAVMKKATPNAKNLKLHKPETEKPVQVDFTTPQYNLITASEKINIVTTERSILTTNIESNTRDTIEPLREELRTGYPYTSEINTMIPENDIIPEKITEINTMSTKNLNTKNGTFLDSIFATEIDSKSYLANATFTPPFLNTPKSTTKSEDNFATKKETTQRVAFKTKNDNHFSVDVTTKSPSIITAKRATKYVTIKTHEAPNIKIKEGETHLLMEIPREVNTESDKIVSIENRTQQFGMRNTTQEIIAESITKINMSTLQINFQKMPFLNVSRIGNLTMDTLLINSTSSQPLLSDTSSTKLNSDNVLTNSTFLQVNSKQTFEQQMHPEVPESKQEPNGTVFSLATYTLMTDNNFNKKDNNTMTVNNVHATELYIVTTMPSTGNIIRSEDEIKEKPESSLETLINKVRENSEATSTVKVYSVLTQDKNTTKEKDENKYATEIEMLGSVVNGNVKKDDKHYELNIALDKKNKNITQSLGNSLTYRECNFSTVPNNFTNSDIQTTSPIADSKIVSFQKVDYNNSTQNIDKVFNNVKHEHVISDVRKSRDVDLRNQSIAIQNDKHVSFDTRYKLDRFKDINNTPPRTGQTDITFKSRHNKNVARLGNSSANKFTCEDRFRGKYSDSKDCRKFYICIGKIYPLLRECPLNTVFSEINKQCTKNLSHCIRNNQFHCTQEGRFSDALKSNIYYICVKNKNAYVRFQFQCQDGYYLNKANVRCIINERSQSRKSSTSIDSDSTKVSDQSTVERKPKERKHNRTNIQKNHCRKEGKFPDPDDCRRYYVCSRNSKSEFRRRRKKCESDEVFHREKERCVDSESYECNS